MTGRGFKPQEENKYRHTPVFNPQNNFLGKKQLQKKIKPQKEKQNEEEMNKEEQQKQLEIKD